jgi:uncharacterized protein
MCGGLVISTCKTPAQQLAYHAYRLIGYLLLGSIAGIFGASIRNAPFFAHISQTLFILIGIGMIIMGINLLYRPTASLHIPFFDLLFKRLFSVAISFKKESVAYAGLVGLATAFLPCGWLFMFILTAVSTGTVLKSMGVMTLFWLGSLPALLIVPTLIQKCLGATKKIATRLPGILMISIGLYTIFSRYVFLIRT